MSLSVPISPFTKFKVPYVSFEKKTNEINRRELEQFISDVKSFDFQLNKKIILAFSAYNFSKYKVQSKAMLSQNSKKSENAKIEKDTLSRSPIKAQKIFDHAVYKIDNTELITGLAFPTKRKEKLKSLLSMYNALDIQGQLAKLDLEEKDRVENKELLIASMNKMNSISEIEAKSKEEDVINVIQAAEKTIDLAVAPMVTQPANDLNEAIQEDYSISFSKKEDPKLGLNINPVLKEEKLINPSNRISNRVHDVISREMSRRKNIKLASNSVTPNEKTKNFGYANGVQGYPTIAPKKSVIPEPQTIDDMLEGAGFLEDKEEEGNVDEERVSGQLFIKTSRVLLNKHSNLNKDETLFVPDFDKNEHILSDLDGIIKFPTELRGTHSIVRGVVRTEGALHTIIELDSMNSKHGQTVPLFDRETFYEVLEKEKLPQMGSHLLIKLGDKIDDVELENGSYKTRILLNEKFQMVNNDDSFEYALFLSVRPGNVLISYLLSDDKLAEKVIHISSDLGSESYIHYDEPTFLPEQRENFSLFEKLLLGTSKSELLINSEYINYFNLRVKSEAVSINEYSIKRPSLPSGMRKYLELKHDSKPVYIGYYENSKIEIPSREYALFIQDKILKLNSLKNTCLVQVNLDKPVKDILISGETSQGPMVFDFKYLDSDGQDSEYANELTKKLFLSGEVNGIFNLKIIYEDNSFQALRTYCSDETYIIEQL